MKNKSVYVSQVSSFFFLEILLLLFCDFSQGLSCGHCRKWHQKNVTATGLLSKKAQTFFKIHFCNTTLLGQLGSVSVGAAWVKFYLLLQEVCRERTT
jgi:hypothetical protein